MSQKRELISDSSCDTLRLAPHGSKPIPAAADEAGSEVLELLELRGTTEKPRRLPTWRIRLAMDDQARHEAIPRPGKWKWRYLLVLALLGLGVYLLLPQLTTFKHSLDVLRSLAWWAVLLAVIAQVFSYLGNGYLLHAIVAASGQQLSILRGTLIAAASYSAGLLIGGTAGSAALTYRWIRGSRVSDEAALLAVTVPSVAIDAALLLASIFGLVYLFAVHQLTTGQLIGFGIMLALLVFVAAGLLWGIRHQPQLVGLAVRAASWWARIRRQSYDPATTEASVSRLFRDLGALEAGGWRGVALGAALNTVFDMATLYFLFVAAGHVLAPGEFLAGYGLPLLLGKLPLLPGGVGIVETSMVALYHSLGVPEAVCVVVVLSYRFISFWLPLLLGFAAVPYLQRVGGAEAAEA